MRKIYLAMLCLCCIHGYAQVSVRGSVIDTSESKPLSNAVVSLITESDSLLYKFTRTNAEGSFRFAGLPSQKYLILITYPGYADYFDTLAYNVKMADLSKIPLTKKSQLLETVIFSQRIAAIRMRGDTLAYRADSFATKQGATVEDLLKKLPGIQVDRNGQITAQGQKVTKVLVDGEEFFSDDPAVVTQGLPADAVKEVQVFDKKSDQAEFTGIDDGKGSRTINLTLKEDRKKGYFGKLKVGGGTRQTFDNNLMLNAFKGSRKLSAFGIMSNTGKEGLDWDENRRFGGGDNVVYDEEEGYFYSYMDDNDGFDDQYSSQGLPTAWSGGLHYSNKWDKEARNLNADYKFLKRDLRYSGNTISQFILPDTQYFKNESNNATSFKFRHYVRGVYDLKRDSLTSMKLTVSGYHNEIRNSSAYNSTSLNEDHGLVNSNLRNLDSRAIQDGLKGALLWRKKFHTKGRTLSINLDEQMDNQSLDGFLRSNTNYYDPGGSLNKNETIDQRKSNTGKGNNLTARAVYTEPLSKISFLSLSYAFQLSQFQSFKNTFNKDSAGPSYSVKDPLFSNDFRFRYHSNIASADYKINKKKLIFLLGSGLSYSQYNQTDLARDSSSHYSFVNFFPKAFLRISPSPQHQFRLSYNGRTNAPKLEQLQPVRVNNDPLNVQTGNPSLRQEFNHEFNLNYNDYKVVKQSYLYGYLSNVFTQNAISTSSNVDSLGKTTFQYINVKSKYNANLTGGYGRMFSSLKIRGGGGLSIRTGQNRNRINGLDNINDFRTYSLELNANKYKEDKFSVNLNTSINYNFSKTSLRPDVTTKYFSSESYLNFWVQLPWKMEFSTDGNINLRQKTDVFDRNRNSTKIDMHYTKKFGKQKNTELSLSCFDLLDQNIGFDRSVNTNFISEQSYQTLRRYWMLSLQYNISKNPK